MVFLQEGEQPVKKCVAGCGGVVVAKVTLCAGREGVIGRGRRGAAASRLADNNKKKVTVLGRNVAKGDRLSFKQCR